MPRKREHKPRLPTRERRIYLASARAFAAAFRAAFADPLDARRAFRACVEWHSDDEAVARLRFDPDAFGASAPNGVPAVAADPAFLYWTQRARRPRVLLIEVAAALWTEFERRVQAARVSDAERCLTTQEHRPQVQRVRQVRRPHPIRRPHGPPDLKARNLAGKATRRRVGGEKCPSHPSASAVLVPNSRAVTSSRRPVHSPLLCRRRRSVHHPDRRRPARRRSYRPCRP